MDQSKDLVFQKSRMVEFLTHQDLIRQKIEEGYSRLSIWTTLTDAKMVSMTYSYFLRLCRDQFDAGGKPGPMKESPAAKKSPEAEARQKSKAQGTLARPGTEEGDGRMLGGFKMDPDRPKRAPIEMPKPMTWNPIPLTEEEIKTGKITSR